MAGILNEVASAIDGISNAVGVHAARHPSASKAIAAASASVVGLAIARWWYLPSEGRLTSDQQALAGPISLSTTTGNYFGASITKTVVRMKSADVKSAAEVLSAGFSADPVLNACCSDVRTSRA